MYKTILILCVALLFSCSANNPLSAINSQVSIQRINQLPHDVEQYLIDPCVYYLTIQNESATASQLRYSIQLEDAGGNRLVKELRNTLSRSNKRPYTRATHYFEIKLLNAQNAVLKVRNVSTTCDEEISFGVLRGAESVRRRDDNTVYLSKFCR